MEKHTSIVLFIRVKTKRQQIANYRQFTLRQFTLRNKCYVWPCLYEHFNWLFLSLSLSCNPSMLSIIRMLKFYNHFSHSQEIVSLAEVSIRKQASEFLWIKAKARSLNDACFRIICFVNSICPEACQLLIK